MIQSFSHKGLEELFKNGKTSKLPQERVKKIRLILAVLNNAVKLKDIAAPGNRLHKLKKPPLEGFWSVDISGNYRIVFSFDEANGIVEDVDFLDTH